MYITVAKTSNSSADIFVNSLKNFYFVEHISVAVSEAREFEQMHQISKRDTIHLIFKEVLTLFRMRLFRATHAWGCKKVPTP